jgi:hypothetical protein
VPAAAHKKKGPLSQRAFFFGACNSAADAYILLRSWIASTTMEVPMAINRMSAATRT